MTQPRQLPDDFDRDEAWRQLAQQWDHWQRQSPQATRVVAGAVLLIAVFVWVGTGVYTVGPGEQGVVRRFGKEVARTGPGLRYHWPRPIARVDVVNLEVVRRVEVGFRSEPQHRLVPQESLMLTGDENIVDAQAIVQYRVKDPGAYLFRVADPDQALRDATEVGLRSVIGRTTIEEVLTVGRVEIQDQTRAFLQQLLDTYQAGLMVTEVKLQVVDPPEQVKDAFHEVVRAREDRERLINEAKGYQEDVIPKARGQAEQILRAAEAYRTQRELRAQGEAAKFMAILTEYTKAPEVTEQRLYVETLQRVLPKAQKIVISPQLEGNLLPLLPLREQTPTVLPAPPPDGQRSQCPGDSHAVAAAAREGHAMRRVRIGVFGIIVVLGVVLTQVLFIIDEHAQAIVTQFGAYVRTITAPRLHAKVPFVQTVHRFDRRVLATDAPPAEYLTLDKKRVVVDYVARWRITDPLAFFKSVRTLAGARARIEDIVFSQLRQELASQDFAPVTSELREPTMEAVAQAARVRMVAFGIELIDVRIKRADLPSEVQQSVFARMVAERGRIAKRYRSEGEEEAAKIRAETDKQREILLAQAYERSQRLQGEGDAAATAIYAQAYEHDPRFYVFFRTLEAYDDILTPETLLVLPGDADMFRLLSRVPATVKPMQGQ